MNVEKKFGKIQEVVILALILIIFIILSCYKQTEKADYNMDEIVTYSFANNTGNKQWEWQKKLDNPKESLEVFFTTNEYNPPFNYKNVWQNSQEDTHPPFYYMLVHTVSSVCYGKFNKWIPFSINVFWGCLMIFMVYKLAGILMEKELAALFCAFIFAINPALIEMVTFLRMYVMGMFCCVLLTYLVVKYLGGWRWNFYFFNVGVFIFGSLTHYYFLVYAFFVYGIIVLYDLLHKDFKNFGKLILSGVLGAGTVLAIFPAIIDHIFVNGDGPKNFDNLFRLSDYLMRIREFFGYLNGDVFNGIIVIFIMAAMAGFILAYKKYKNLFLWRIIVLIVPSVCFFFIVAKVAPYIQDRYICLIYPEVIAGVFTGIWQLIRTFAKNKTVSFSTLLCGSIFFIMEASAYPKYEWDYTLKAFITDIQPQIDEVKSYDCIVDVDAGWKIWVYYQQLAQYSTITYMKTNQEIEIDSRNYTGDAIVLYLASDDDTAVLNKFLECFEQYDSYEKIIPEGSSLCNIYLIR